MTLNTNRNWKIVSGILAVSLFLVIFEVNLEPRALFNGNGEYRTVSDLRDKSDIPFVGVIPSGIPLIYGAELEISYNDVSSSNPAKADMTIEKMAQLDISILLEEGDLERYIDILYIRNGGMSCEYCCGARSIIFENGEPACGCAHSYAMRGLAKYLITEHGSEFSDDEILNEIGKWKVLFFPDIHERKAGIMKQNGIDIDYISLTTNLFRGIETGSSAGEMVGGC